MSEFKNSWGDIPKEFDQRADAKKGRAISENKTDLYDSLVNIVLNHKSELQKLPGLAAPKVAQKWAEDRGLRFRDHDLNNDGIMDSVIYNKAGQPFIINGYKIKPSDYKVRRDYYEANPTTEKRIGNPMKSWAQHYYYDINEDPERPWKQSVKKTDKYREAKTWGYKLGTKPKKQQTPFAYFSRLINPMIKQFFENDVVTIDIDGASAEIPCITRLVGGNSGVACGTVIKKIISPISLARALFVMLVERSAFYDLIIKTGIQGTYDHWKKWKKDNKERFYNYFFTNFLDETKRSFNKRITLAQISSVLCRDEMNFTGSDPEDVLVFLIGIPNFQDENFASLLQDNSKAEEFLYYLKSPDPQQSVTAKKILERMKKISQASVKEWFLSGIKLFFENQQSLDRYNEYRQSGLDPNIAPSIGTLQSSPTKSGALTKGTTDETPEDRNEV